MDVHLLPAAADELRALPTPERRAMLNALEKLQVIGPQLPYPHSSQVKTSALRELRPRAGRSPWRALYRQVKDRLVILAIVPEAQHDNRGFRRGLAAAEERLAAYERTS